MEGFFDDFDDFDDDYDEDESMDENLEMDEPCTGDTESDDDPDQTESQEDISQSPCVLFVVKGLTGILPWSRLKLLQKLWAILIKDIPSLTQARWQGMENERGVFCMSYQDYIPLRERWREEDQRKKECEPYEEIIRWIRKRDMERAMLEQSPSDGRS